MNFSVIHSAPTHAGLDIGTSTMKLRQFQVDAFASRVFEGNPAAVVPLEQWLDDTLLQAVAEENNLSETAFFIPTERGYHLRWFTPVAEVDLCGHATLATAHVLYEHLGFSGSEVVFETRSGDLKVRRTGGLLEMNFPAQPSHVCEVPAALLQGLGHPAVEVLAAVDYIVVFEHEHVVRGLRPDLMTLQKLDLRAVAVTTPGESVDFVSRFFAPKVGVPEDPVTGSAHCKLIPYWAARLGKTKLRARQVSKRGGDLHCELQGERVVIAGTAVTFLQAEIELPQP